MTLNHSNWMFRGRDFLSLLDFSRREIETILDTARDLKLKVQHREPHEYLRGRSVAILFEKPSTRTRTSFQAALAHLGAQSFYMRPDEMQLARGEPVKDTARVIDRYCDALVMRTFGQDRIEEFAKYMNNPVLNALTDLTHPCQGLADLLTISEYKGQLDTVKVCYAGDLWNVCHSLIIAASIFGFKLHVARPNGYEANERIMNFAKAKAQQTGAEILLTDDLRKAVKDADVLYANTWHSMGAAEKEKEKRLRDFAPFQLNQTVAEAAKSNYIFMHCLPGYRGEEMTDEIIESSHSVVWDQAENRMHTEKAVLALTIA
jgi:ornithine carbamoyltransferase